MKKSLRTDILNQASGLHSMNTSGARWYAYCHNEKMDKIASGEFVWLSKGEPKAIEFDGYIDLKSHEIVEFQNE